MDICVSLSPVYSWLPMITIATQSNAQKNSYPKAAIFISGGPIRTWTWDQRIMRADTQRKPLGFQEVTLSGYRCVSICVTRLTRTQQVIPRSLVFITKEFLEQPSSTSLLQSTFWWVSVTLSNTHFSGRWLTTHIRHPKKNHPKVVLWGSLF